MHQFERPEIPLRSLVLSFAVLAVPAFVTLFLAQPFGDYESLLWLTALVPAFLLAYYRGWRGVATAMSIGMAVLVSVQILTLVFDRAVERGTLFGGVLAAYLGIGVGLGVLAELIHRERNRAETAALTDALTRIPNRRYADLILPREFAGAQRGRDFTVCLFDLDHFKAYNDEHGHRAGDEALRRFAGVLMANTRTMNLSARYGGEEFIALLSSTPDTGALVFANRVREQIAQSPPEAGPITVSVGVAQYQPEMSHPRELVEAADQALYRAKAEGRDTVVVAGADSVSGTEEGDPPGPA